MESKVIQFLEHLIEKHYEKAKKACSDAKIEISDVERTHGTVLKKSQKEAVDEVKKIIDNLDRKQHESARISALSVASKYRQHIVGSLLKSRASSEDVYTVNQDKDKQSSEHTWLEWELKLTKDKLQRAEEEKNREKQNEEVLSRHERKKPAIQGDEVSGKSLPHSSAQQKSTRNTFDNGATITPAETPEVLSVGGRKQPAIQGDEVSGKRVSQARRQDNIADLSDVNRPTKIAERFSELFDNEWAEVFESLSKNKGDEQLKEPEIISILLEIVEQAYQFCYDEAKDQITKIELAVAGILRGDARPAVQSVRSYQRQRHLLLQYRKELAADAKERLSEEFFQRCIFRIFENNSLGIPSNGGPTATYSRKAVELTWLMCVEDPPIFMCPTRGKFNPSLYRPYTKTGTEADIFVWPALKLNKDGAILVKGVVQYK